MSTETMVAAKVPVLMADAITKDKAGTYTESDLMAMGVPAALAVVIAAQADNVNALMALGIPALPATVINTDISA